MGVVTDDFKDEALERARKPHDGTRIGAAFLAMLGVEPRKTDVEL